MIGRLLSTVSSVPPLVARGAAFGARHGWRAASRGAGAAKTASLLALVLGLALTSYSAYVGYEGAAANLEAKVAAPARGAAAAVEDGYEGAVLRADRFVGKCLENPEYSLPSLFGLGLSVFTIFYYRAKGHSLAAAAVAAVTKLPPGGAPKAEYDPALAGLSHAEREIRYDALVAIQADTEKRILARDKGLDARRDELKTARGHVERARTVLAATELRAAEAEKALALELQADDADKKKLIEVDAALARLVEAA